MSLRPLSALLALVLPVAAFAQGALTPPGAPAPTMKSLAELDASLSALAAKAESRVAIDDLPGDGSALHVISAPGSYYLRGNLTGAVGRSGIRVDANGVSLDLNGQALRGIPGASAAILINPANGRTVIRHGTISAWSSAVSPGTDLLIEGLVVDSCTAAGLNAGTNSIVRNCTVTNCTALGISATIVDACVVTNTTGTADTVGINSTIARNCHVNGVTTTAGTAFGLSGSSLVDCVVEGVSGPTAKGLLAPSIYSSVASGCTVNAVTATTGQAFGAYYVGTLQNCVVNAINGTGSETTYGAFVTKAEGVRVRFVQSTGTSVVGMYCIDAAHDCSLQEIYGTTFSAVGLVAQTCIGCNVGSVTAPTASGCSSEIAQNVRVDAVSGTAGSATGIAGKTVVGCRVLNLNATANAYGIDATVLGTVNDSRVVTLSGCTGTTGTCLAIQSGTVRGSLVQSVTGNLATTVRGILASNVNECTVMSVLSSQVVSIYGIQAGRVSGCTVRDVDNSSVNISAFGIGIASATVGGSGNTGLIEHNLVAGCTHGGISVSGVNRVVGNTCEDNVAVGIAATGNSTISDNHTQGHTTGYSISGAGNFVVRNVSVGDTTAFTISATSRYAPIVVGAGAGVAFDSNANIDL